jgi:RNA polymerase sigma-70 factor, ECF subfamily
MYDEGLRVSVKLFAMLAPLPMPIRALGAVRDAPPDDERAAREARDSALAVRVSNGDAVALSDLINHHLGKLVGVARAVLGSNELVEDVLQDVFLTVWEQRHALDTQRDVVGYLHRAVRNRSISILRQERSRQRITDDVATSDTDLRRASINDADEWMEHADIDIQVRIAVRALSPALREVFLLSWNAGLTYQEIATLLDISVGTVQRRMHRATRRLAQTIPRPRS